MPITRRLFLKGLSYSFLAGTGTFAYTWFLEPHWLDITRRIMPIKNLPEVLVGKSLVQISDIHIGKRVSDEYLINSFEKIKREQPDIVVYTGDFLDYKTMIPSKAAHIFSKLPLGKIATLGILGNHDYGRNWAQLKLADRVENLAVKSGVTILRNAIGSVEGLHFIGLDDLWARQFKPDLVSRAFKKNAPLIVLSHNPDTVDLPIWKDFNGWILTGHTHGGQCKPPFLPPPLLPVKNRKYTSGEFLLSNGRKMYINRGLGHLLQVRFNVRPEITVFKLLRV